MMYSSLRNSYPLTISLRSTTTFSAGQMYCCFTRTLSGRCSMLKEIPLLRAPEKSRTGMEMSPKVKCPDQTDEGIVLLAREGCNRHNLRSPRANSPRIGSLAYKWGLDAQKLEQGESKCEAGGMGVGG